MKPIVVKELRLWNEFENYEIRNVVGTGGWGKVYSAFRRSDQKLVALKFFGYTQQFPIINSINSEVMLMMSLIGVPGVVQMESLFYDTPEGFVEGKNPQYLQSYPVIVMEMVSGGELFHRIKRQVDLNQIPSESYLANMFVSVIMALESIHRRNYIHRDLKLDNLLLVSHLDDSPIKIIDFGCMVQLPLGHMIYHRNNELAGTPGCYAPESLLRCEYSFKSDIWQAGCILYSLLCGHPPFYSESKYRPYIIQGKFCQSPQWNSLSNEAKNLIQQMLEVDPLKRISIAEILKHEWVTGRASQAELGKEYADRVHKLALREKLKKIFQKWESKQHDFNQLTPSLPPLPPSPLSPLSGRPLLPAAACHDDLVEDHISETLHSPLLTSQRIKRVSSADSSLSNSFIFPHRNVTTHLNNSKRWFDLLDKDRDGAITREELIEGVVGILFEEDHWMDHTTLHSERTNSHPLASPPAAPAAAPSTPSGDREGAPPSSCCPAVHVNVEELFLVMDRNCSGTIDYQEFTHFYDMILQSSSLKMGREDGVCERERRDEIEEEGSQGEEGEGEGESGPTEGSQGEDQINSLPIHLKNSSSDRKRKDFE